MLATVSGRTTGLCTVGNSASRGKRLVVLVGMPKAVAIAMKRADAIKRHSALRLRLRQDNGKR